MTPQELKQKILQEYDDLLKTFNINKVEPKENEVAIESAVKSFLLKAIDESYEAGKLESIGAIDAKVITQFNNDLKDESSIIYKMVKDTVRSETLKEVLEVLPVLPKYSHKFVNEVHQRAYCDGCAREAAFKHSLLKITNKIKELMG